MTASEQSTDESQTSAFRADTSHQVVGLAQQSEQSAFESDRVASKADATTTTESHVELDTEDVEETTNGHPDSTCVSS